VRAVMVLSENWTIIDPGDLGAVVDLAVAAEAAGVDTVMLSEHIVLGPSAGARGRMTNPRDYAAPGNQDPATPWPDSVVLAAAIGARTTRLRVALAAVITPLRHPLQLAKQLGTLDVLLQGRLVVQPTVSWAEEEYVALGVPFHQRGAILDEQLAAMRAAWTQSPAHHDGPRFPFGPVWCEPRPARPPTMWFGGEHLTDAHLRRLVAHGHGFHPFGRPTAEERDRLRRAWEAAGRTEPLELVGGIRATFHGADDAADLDVALADVPRLRAEGWTSVCFKPNHFTDDLDEVPAVCERVVTALA
jgi:alkanesulfonate monooxygenase SsuD/methylene tetrahydromethanopterin reductase-like flavin-dependent oxidoreductase (luciferase family)